MGDLYAFLMFYFYNFFKGFWFVSSAEVVGLERSQVYTGRVTHVLA